MVCLPHRTTRNRHRRRHLPHFRRKSWPGRGHGQQIVVRAYRACSNYSACYPAAARRLSMPWTKAAINSPSQCSRGVAHLVAVSFQASCAHAVEPMLRRAHQLSTRVRRLSCAATPALQDTPAPLLRSKFERATLCRRCAVAHVSTCVPPPGRDRRFRLGRTWRDSRRTGAGLGPARQIRLVRRPGGATVSARSHTPGPIGFAGGMPAVVNRAPCL